MRTLFIFSALTSLLPLGAALGCSDTVVDLSQGLRSPVHADHAPVFIDSADAGSSELVPFRIVDHEQTQLYPEAPIMTVRSGRLYWLSQRATASAGEYSLKQCEVTNCAATLVTSTPRSAPLVSFVPEGIRLDGNTAYFWRDHVSNALLKCDLTANATIEDIVMPAGVVANPGFSVSAGMIYLTTWEGAAFQCNAANCAQTADRFDLTPPPGLGPAFAQSLQDQDEQYLYLEGALTAAPLYPVLRVKKDPRASYEIIANWSGIHGLSLKAQGDNIYWNGTDYTLRTCPKSGCVGEPATIVSGFLANTFAVDDTSAYLVTRRQTFTDSSGRVIPAQILKCPITGCDAPEVVYTAPRETTIGGIVLDGDFVYFQGFDCTSDTPAQRLWSDCMFIAALPK